jgi:Fic family protein
MNIAEKLKSIEILKKHVDALQTKKDWDDAFFRKVKLDFTYNSNKLEGNTLTYGQTIKLLRDFITPQNAASGELLDMINHQKVLDIVFSTYRTQIISEENIKALHKELMKNIDQWSDDGLYSPGQYKIFENVTVRPSGKIHAYLQPAEVEAAMGKLVDQTNFALTEIDADKIEKHALFVASYFHQQFLNAIHPFSDGNGRIGRIMMNLILLKNGYPPVFIKDVDRNKYLKIFEISDVDLNPMLEFMADRLVESMEEKLAFIKER